MADRPCRLSSLAWLESGPEPLLHERQLFTILSLLEECIMDCGTSQTTVLSSNICNEALKASYG